MYLSPEKTTLLSEPSPAKVVEIIQDRIRIRWQATNWDAYLYSNPNSNPMWVVKNNGLFVQQNLGWEKVSDLKYFTNDLGASFAQNLSVRPLDISLGQLVMIIGRKGNRLIGLI